MKIIQTYFLTLLLCFFSSCSEKKEAHNESLVGTLEKAYANFLFPGMEDAPGYLFFECNITNHTKSPVTFEFTYDVYDRERVNRLFLITDENDSLRLFLRSVTDRDFKILPDKSKTIDFCLDTTSEFFRRSGMDNYYMFQDSLAFVVDRIIYKFSDDSGFTIRKKDKLDFIIEHRVSLYTTEGEGFKN